MRMVAITEYVTEAEPTSLIQVILLGSHNIQVECMETILITLSISHHRVISPSYHGNGRQYKIYISHKHNK